MARKFPWKALTTGAATLVTADFVLRPWFLHWGATKGEVKKTLPGDELCPDAASVATRAITIHAPAEEVWPWLAQIGQDRGGFYSYSWLENLVGAKIHNASRILPKLPALTVGDSVWMTPSSRYGGKGRVKVAMIEAGRYLVLVSLDDFEAITRAGEAREGTWAFILEPIDDHTTRLLIRSRSGRTASLDRFVVFDPIHFILERKMMLGIRQRAEGKARKIAA
jgi:hypothetical protein